jgi:hypothetical protein
MADYTPVYLPGDVIPMTASAAITAGQLLQVTGNNTVGPVALAAAPSVNVIGVAGQDTTVNGRVTVYGFGPVHESVPVGTVTAGDQLTTPVTGDTAGAQVKTLAPVTTPTAGDVVGTRALLGVALTTATNPNKVRWMQMS